MTPEQQATIREAVEEAVHEAICNDDDAASIADAAMAAHLKALEAAGWVPCPVEPTPDMALTGGQLLIDKYRGNPCREYAAAENVWRTMIATRPR